LCDKKRIICNSNQNYHIIRSDKMFFQKDHREKEPRFLVTFGSFNTKSDLLAFYAKTARYYYFLLLKRFVLIMDELHWLNDYYINITHEFNDEFSKIARVLETIEERSDEIVRIERKINDLVSHTEVN